jgi:hypothetical protein
MTNQDLIHACDRARQGIDEVKANAVRLVQLESEVKRAEQALAGLKGKIAQAEPLTKQIDELDQTGGSGANLRN